MPFMNKAFGRATAIPRKLRILPEEAATPQKLYDIARGKKKAKRKSLLTSSMKRGGLLTEPYDYPRTSQLPYPVR